MTTKSSTNPNKYLSDCQKVLVEAQARGDNKEISLAHAYLGYALFLVRKYTQGMENFDKALELASDEGEEFQVRCLGIKTVAYRDIKRYPDAYKTVEEILKIAEQTGNDGIRCDAIISQGNILQESGEPVISLERLKEGLAIAKRLGDKRRMMNAFGSMGDLSIAVASNDKAEEYLEEAIALARELGDKRAEYGYLGNLGIVYVWQKRYIKAADNFKQVLGYLQKSGEKDAEIQVLRHLVQIHSALNEPEKVIDYAHEGLELVRGKDNETAFIFYENLVKACYLLNHFKEGNAGALEAIELARAAKNEQKEFEFLISLGESYVVTDEIDKALGIYRQALDLARRTDKDIKAAYLTGRVGFALAELGNLEDAIPLHKEAVELARAQDLPDLEGEQLTMLAMAYRDLGALQEAMNYCKMAIDVFREAKLDSQETNINKFLKEIEALQTS
ncbi:MAG: tetratricopeptide repeat protein [Anaerolineales bacterium]|nr:tetratricopeptide repeat protein [Anaerolineales bacterium]HEY61965.1 tetratricopeptide repeat protein [Anaerolineae bacterium]